MKKQKNNFTMNKDSPIYDPELDFTPLFYILDKCQLTVLAAEKQDKYEVSGVYISFNNESGKYEICKANFNSQLPWEFPTRFTITNDKDEALLFSFNMSTAKPLPDDWCLEQYPRAKDFPKY